MATTEYLFYFKYGKTEVWVETLLQQIGASALLTLAEVEYHNNNNSVYVSWEGEDGSGGDGTKENPYRTIQYAKDMMDSNHSIITILDSNYYYTGDAIDLYFDVNGIILQGAEGQKPILRIDPNIASQLTMLRLQNGGKIINVEIQVSSEYEEQVTGIDAREGTIKNVTIDSASKYGIQKSTSDIVDLENTIIKNSVNAGSTDGVGVLVSEGTLNISRCLISGNDYCGLKVIGASNKDITIDHTTISDNQYGIYTTGASNIGTFTIENSIIYKNAIYDHYGDDGEYSYSCIGKIQGSPTLTTTTNIIRVSPLFVGVGDYRLRSKYNGYGDSLMLSPCLGVSDIGGDLGCYEYSRSLTSQTFTTFGVTPPDSYKDSKEAVDVKKVTTNSLKLRFLNKGMVNRVDIGWSGNDNALTADQYTTLANMFAAEGEVYMSIDRGETYKAYLIDKTKGFSGDRALVIEDNTLRKNIDFTLYEV